MGPLRVEGQDRSPGVRKRSGGPAGSELLLANHPSVVDHEAGQPKPTDTPSSAIRGLLIVDKPRGPTSMTVCARVRAALRRGGAPKRVKVGHGGTLDPLATGLLVVLCGKATPLCDQVMRGEKRYLAGVDLSAFTTTDDQEGDRTEVDVSTPPSRAAIQEALDGFVGNIMQRPPVFSAMKVNGRRAYALARDGQDVQLEPRPVVVHSIDVLEYQWPFAALDIKCGKGVYIRSIARDLGVALRTGGSLASLRRTAVGPFSIDHATPVDELPAVLTQAELEPVDRWLAS